MQDEAREQPRGALFPVPAPSAVSAVSGDPSTSLSTSCPEAGQPLQVGLGGIRPWVSSEDSAPQQWAEGSSLLGSESVHRAKPVVPEDGETNRGQSEQEGRRPAAGPPGSSLGLGATAVQGRASAGPRGWARPEERRAGQRPPGRGRGPPARGAAVRHQVRPLPALPEEPGSRDPPGEPRVCAVAGWEGLPGPCHNGEVLMPRGPGLWQVARQACGQVGLMLLAASAGSLCGSLTA